MKRITNINDPNNVIIVSDAYINGDRIVCITEEEEFDLWRNYWKLEDLPEQASDYCKENCKGYRETGKCFADGLCVGKQETSKEQKPSFDEAQGTPVIGQKEQ